MPLDALKLDGRNVWRTNIPSFHVGENVYADIHELGMNLFYPVSLFLSFSHAVDLEEWKVEVLVVEIQNASPVAETIIAFAPS